MYHNNKNNAKVRYKTLFDADLQIEVWNDQTKTYRSLEKVIMNERGNDNNLFLAAE